MLSHSPYPYQQNVIPMSPLSHTFERSVSNQRRLKEPTSPCSVVSCPTTFDILLGKDSSIYNHDGNRKFRSIIYSHIDNYMAASNKTSKSKIVHDLHSHLQSSGYRFLRKINDNRGHGFLEIKSREARQKISHALRDGARERQKKGTSSSCNLVDEPSTSDKNTAGKTREPASDHRKGKIDKDLTKDDSLKRFTTEMLTLKNQKMDVQAKLCHSFGCSRDHSNSQSIAFQEQPRRVSLSPYRVTHRGNYLTFDKNFQDYEPLDPSIEHGFFDSCDSTCFSSRHVDNSNVDQLLAVVCSL